MPDFVIPPPAIPAVAVAGSASTFPVRRVFCVGRNYAAHSREMGRDPDREAPFFFMKPAHAVVAAQGKLAYPPCTQDLHHEIELLVALGGGGADISPENALALVWGYGVGLDLTRRDLQAVAKEMGRPWDFSKGFDASAPCSALRPASEIGHPSDARIWLEVNGAVKQDGNLREMIWSVADIISHISRFVRLAPGDLIFSGTPAGVGPLLPGDRVHGAIAGIADFDFQVGPYPGENESAAQV
ncbi:fumarylpyruvate hydrolase [Janthinobacterium sp. CG_23.3]|uniref:fumarylacetoacetate hydrolase family protein n=1 Tax=Janthinobacterium sp. CG_23.3 TaxID=3349634 RepID=UPI0038D43B5F